MIRKILWPALVSMMLIQMAAFASDSGKFNEANQAYSQGDYQRAADLYSELASGKKPDASLYYNLGNAYFRLNRPGMAYWALNKAHRLAEHDEDIYHNLKYVEAGLTAVQIEDSRSRAARIFDLISSRIGPAGWLVLALLISTAFSIFIVRSFGSGAIRKKDIFKSVILLILIAFCLTAEYCARNHMFSLHQGVIVSPGTDIRYQPSYEGAAAFRLPEGAVVPVIRKHDDWYQIRVSREKSGWVNEQEFKIL